MPKDALDLLLSQALDARRAEELYRSRRIVDPIDATHVEVAGRRLVNFCSNNYLGLTHHRRVLSATRDVVQRAGAGAAASPLICGYTPAHAAAEAALARWKGTQSAILLPSGYQANHAAIQTIAASAQASGRAVRFLIDKLAHASLIDALRGCAAAGKHSFRVFAHNDIDKLSRLLDGASADEIQVVVTESIFSMDGDPAALKEIVALKQRRPFVLLVDEAHGSGVYGPGGAGLAAELGLTAEVDLFVVTLSKALGLAGGAICASAVFCDAAVNFGRAYIYSTSVPASIAAGCIAAIEVMDAEPQHQQRVRELARRVRQRLSAGGLAFPSGDSPIIPIILGEESRALAAAEMLDRAGLMVLPVRPPTVPRGSSRLRVTLSAAHSDDDIEALIQQVGQGVRP